VKSFYIHFTLLELYSRGDLALCRQRDLLEIVCLRPRGGKQIVQPRLERFDQTVVLPLRTFLTCALTDVQQRTFKDVPDLTTTRWSMSSDTYIKRAIADVEQHLENIGETLVKQRQPICGDYRPELDDTPLLNDKLTNYYQGLIGVLRWATELGRVDILMPVSIMSSYMAAPCVGHLYQLFHIFGYLKTHLKSKMVFDDTRPQFDEHRFVKCDWRQYYPGAEDPLPPNMPQPRGKFVIVSCYVDADHTGCRVTRHSHTGVLILVYRSPILWLSKKQNTVETSTFGSEFVALKTAVEMIDTSYVCLEFHWKVWQMYSVTMHLLSRIHLDQSLRLRSDIMRLHTTVVAKRKRPV
jgi:hypothetical protein